MNKISLIVLLTLATIAVSTKLTAGDGRFRPQPLTYLQVGTLLAVPGEAPKSEQTIVITNNQISEILDGFVDPPAGDAAATVIDMRDRFAMPGFIDLHVHVSFEAGPGRQMLRVTKSDAYLALTSQHYAYKTLMAGFTTLRDLGSSGNEVFALRDAIKDGLVAGPKLVVAGRAITPTGGHGDIHGYRQEILDAMPASGVCDGEDDCRRVVRAMVKRGADVIKVTATGGVTSNTNAGTSQQFTDGELKVIAETAHALGRKVTAHAHRKEGIEAALRAGFDSIEHSMWADEETMKLFKKTGAWLIPTVYPITAVGDTPEKMKKGPFRDMPPNIMAKLLQLGRQPKDMTKMAYEMGVNIALGTDSGVSPHGENANEFIEYVNIGMSNMESLMAGTVHAAEAAGIDNIGAIKPGYAADIVAMLGNPLEDINAVLGVSMVMRDGIVFKHQ